MMVLWLADYDSTRFELAHHPIHKMVFMTSFPLPSPLNAFIFCCVFYKLLQILKCNSLKLSVCLLASYDNGRIIQALGLLSIFSYQARLFSPLSTICFTHMPFYLRRGFILFFFYHSRISCLPCLLLRV
jgi:hypothetical protein